MEKGNEKWPKCFPVHMCVSCSEFSAYSLSFVMVFVVFPLAVIGCLCSDLDFYPFWISLLFINIWKSINILKKNLLCLLCLCPESNYTNSWLFLACIHQLKSGKLVHTQRETKMKDNNPKHGKTPRAQSFLDLEPQKMMYLCASPTSGPPELSNSWRFFSAEINWWYFILKLQGCFHFLLFLSILLVLTCKCKF